MTVSAHVKTGPSHDGLIVLPSPADTVARIIVEDVLPALARGADRGSVLSRLVDAVALVVADARAAIFTHASAGPRHVSSTLPDTVTIALLGLGGDDGSGWQAEGTSEALTQMCRGQSFGAIWTLPIGLGPTADVRPSVDSNEPRPLLAMLAVAVPERRTPTPEERAAFTPLMHAVRLVIDRQPTLTAKLEVSPPQVAELDPLTGVLTRAALLTRLGDLAAGASAQRPLALLLIDLDRFGLLNEEHGSAAGDACLRAMASRLAAAARPWELVARVGGDEFALVVPEAPAGPALDAFAAQLGSWLLPPGTGAWALPSVSVGISVHPVAAGGRVPRALDPGLDGAVKANALDGDALLGRAAAALRAGKAKGRGRVERFDPERHADTHRRLTIEHGLRRALRNGELRVVYQPEIDLDTGTIIGVEALVRWQSTAGLLAPDAFLDVAEESGLIVPIGAWVLREACAQVVRLDSFLTGPPLGLAVNLSARQLIEPDLVDTVRDALQLSGLAPDRLCLELTETFHIADDDTILERLQALRLLGVRIGIDDFGVGHSSLSRLAQLPVDLVKIDRSFVDQIGVDRPKTAIVRAVIALARALGVDIIAEGVEHKGQLDELRAMGCDKAQGYHFSMALAPGDLQRRMAEWVASP